MSRILNSIGLAVLMAALLVGTGAAGVTTTATGDVVNTATINVLDIDIGFNDFSVLNGDGTAANDNHVTTETDSFISVDTNYAIYLQAAETGATTNDGKMATALEANTLFNPLKMCIESHALATLGSGTLPTDPVTVSDQIAAESELDYDATFVQTIDTTDDVADGYTITVTFTASTTA